MARVQGRAFVLGNMTLEMSCKTQPMLAVSDTESVEVAQYCHSAQPVSSLQPPQ